MSISRYFGEERCSDAIYAIYLRKVRYVTPKDDSFLTENHRVKLRSSTPENTSDLLQWETVREKIIRAGTLEKIVEKLIGDDDSMDSRHFNVFFSTYRAFASSLKVLELIIHYYDHSERKSSSINYNFTFSTVQSSIRSILICWMDMYPEDFYEPESDFATLSKLLDFARTNRICDIRSKARRMRETFKKIVVNGGLSAQIPSMNHLIIGHNYEAVDYESCQERANVFDVNLDNCVQIAEQLTFWDAELFKEVLPQQCQGCIWSKRHKKGSEAVYSVRATINQFNIVVQKVMTSIVLPQCTLEFRAKIMSKWIEVARELRALKNFSSLKAVLSSLQSEPVHRLKSTWSLVSNALIAQFHELASIFEVDEGGDVKKARQILEEEGTAKSSPLRRPQLIQNCRRSKSDVNLAECQGTVPYLGTFLTDLSMIDQAFMDYTEDGLLNFEKRRKEFEVIAKIRLFQSAARGYNIPMDTAFCSWFLFLPALDEKYCFIRSLEIEPSTSAIDGDKSYKSPKISTPKASTLTRLFSGLNIDEQRYAGEIQFSESFGEDLWKKEGKPTKPLAESSFLGNFGAFGGMNSSRSFTAPSTPASTISWKGGSEFSPGTVFTSHQRSASGCSSGAFPHQKNSSPSLSHLNARNQSALSERSDSFPDSNDMLTKTARMKSNHLSKNGHQESSSSSPSRTSSASFRSPSPPFYFARVALDDGLQPETAASNYKCIKVENGDRMNRLIERILEKHLLGGDHSDYCLVQLLPDGCEFQLPDKCNPYYAVAPDPSPILNFVLRRRADLDTRPAIIAPSMKKLNRLKRSNLLRWSSGYL